MLQFVSCYVIPNSRRPKIVQLLKVNITICLYLKTRRLYCVEWTPYSTRLMRSTIYNRRFPGPTRVVDANRILIASAVIGGLSRWQTDWQTDHATRSVTISGVHSREAKFCYCLWLQQVFFGTVDSNIHHACLSFVSVHQMAPPYKTSKCLHVGNRTHNSSTGCVGRKNIVSGTRHAIINIKRRERAFFCSLLAVC